GDAAMSFLTHLDRAELAGFGAVPPDQPAIVAAGDEDVAGEGEAGDVALVAAEFLGLGFGRGRVELVDLGVGAGDEQASTIRDAGDGEEDAGAGEVLGELEMIQVHGNLGEWMRSFSRGPAGRGDA